MLLYYKEETEGKANLCGQCTIFVGN